LQARVDEYLQRFEKEISLIRGNFPMWKEPPIGADKNGVKMGELAKPKAFEPYVPSACHLLRSGRPGLTTTSR
jgi:hypothetical protein